jgi:hypothetical protein
LFINGVDDMLAYTDSTPSAVLFLLYLQVSSLADRDAYQVTWCCIQKLCIKSGGRQSRRSGPLPPWLSSCPWQRDVNKLLFHHRPEPSLLPPSVPQRDVKKPVKSYKRVSLDAVSQYWTGFHVRDLGKPELLGYGSSSSGNINFGTSTGDQRPSWSLVNIWDVTSESRGEEIND